MSIRKTAFWRPEHRKTRHFRSSHGRHKTLGRVNIPAVVAGLRTVKRLSSGIRPVPWLASAADHVVRVVGLEPTLLAETEFESVASTIPPHPHDQAPAWQNRARGRVAGTPLTYAGRPGLFKPPTARIAGKFFCSPRQAAGKRSPCPSPAPMGCETAPKANGRPPPGCDFPCPAFLPMIRPQLQAGAQKKVTT